MKIERLHPTTTEERRVGIQNLSEGLWRVEDPDDGLIFLVSMNSPCWVKEKCVWAGVICIDDPHGSSNENFHCYTPCCGNWTEIAFVRLSPNERFALSN